MPEEWIKYAPWAFALLVSLVEITPIKINPISGFLKWVGKQINGDIKEELLKIDRKVDEHEIDRIRWEILDFANSLRRKEDHTKDQFFHIVEVNTKYHALIKEHGIVNGVLDSEYSYIERVYKECLKKGTLL